MSRTKLLKRAIEDCANILGDSPEIVRKRYGKWSPEYERRFVDIMGQFMARLRHARKSRLQVPCNR